MILSLKSNKSGVAETQVKLPQPRKVRLNQTKNGSVAGKVSPHTNAFGLVPDICFLKPDYSGSLPEIPGVLPEFSGSLPEVSGMQPDFSGSLPDFSGKQPDFPGSLPDFSGSKPEKSFSTNFPYFSHFWQKGGLPSLCRYRGVADQNARTLETSTLNIERR